MNLLNWSSLRFNRCTTVYVKVWVCVLMSVFYFITIIVFAFVKTRQNFIFRKRIAPAQALFLRCRQWGSPQLSGLCLGVELHPKQYSSKKGCIKTRTGWDFYEGFLSISHSFTWKEQETLSVCATVAVVLPSALGSGHFSVCVVQDGMALKLIVDWSNLLVDLQQMLYKRLLSPTV